MGLVRKPEKTDRCEDRVNKQGSQETEIITAIITFANKTPSIKEGRNKTLLSQSRDARPVTFSGSSPASQVPKPRSKADQGRFRRHRRDTMDKSGIPNHEHRFFFPTPKSAFNRDRMAQGSRNTAHYVPWRRSIELDSKVHTYIYFSNSGVTRVYLSHLCMYNSRPDMPPGPKPENTTRSYCLSPLSYCM